MWSTTLILYVTLFLVFSESRAEAKTYYFNLNKTSNEFMIRTRLNSNTSAYMNQYPSTIQISELRNSVPRKSNSSEQYTHPLLDPEWDYNWKNITRRKLPAFIQKFYETFSDGLTSPVRILFNARPQNSTILRFNFSDLSVSENISEVELHFYHTIDKKLLQKSLILRLYQLENDYFNDSSLINPDAHKLLNVIYIYQAASGWQVFKLTNALHTWLQERKDLSLFVTVSKPNEEQFSLFRDTNRENFRTFLVLRTESDKRANFENNEDVIESGSCRKHDLYVDFAKLNWMQFIISPPGYHAFNCYGTCFRNKHVPNHLKVTSFIPEIARRPLCCSSVKYSPLPIMFYDKNGNVAIKVYDDMIITACGCR